MQPAISNLFGNKKAQMGGLTTVFIGLGTAAIVILVVLLIFSHVARNIDQTGFTAAENATVSTVKTTTLNAISLSTVALIVLAAVAILGIVLTLRG
jgi:uncharacterized membrane protein YqjE